MVESLDDILLRGELTGGSRDFSFDAELLCGVGEATLGAVMKLDNGLWLDGELNLDAVEIGEVIGRDEFGEVTAAMSVVGRVDGRRSDLDLKTSFSSIEWRGDRFDNISVTGAMRNGGVEGVEIISRDPQIEFDLLAEGANLFKEGEGEEPRYSVDLSLNRLNLKHFGLNRRDTTSTISARVVARAGGDDIERCWLDMQVDSTIYNYNSQTLPLDKIDLRVSSEEGARSLSLSSGFADVEFSSPDKVTQILSFASRALAEYLPALYDDATHDATLARRDSLVDMSVRNVATSQLMVRSRNLNPIANALVGGGINIGDDATLQLNFDPNTYLFDAALNAPYIEQGTTLAIGFNVESSNRSDSLTLRSRIGELFVGTSFIENAT